MRSSNTKCIRQILGVCSVWLIGFSVSVAQAATADFWIQPAAGQDTTLTVGDPTDDTLDLEVWVTLSDGGDVYGAQFYLEPDVGGVVGFDSFTEAIALGPQVHGIDNDPLVGAFGRGLFAEPNPATVSSGNTKLGTFSVTALAVGEVSYSFAASAPFREWSFNYLMENAVVSAAPTAVTITVQPEPASAMMMLLTMGWMARRGRRSGAC